MSLLMLYGWSITPMMYPFSFLFDVPSTAYIGLISANLFVGLTGTLATFTLELYPDDPELQAVNNVLRWLFLLFPNYCLGRGMMDLARNEYIAQYGELLGQASRYKSPFTFLLIGRNLLFMFLEGLICLILIVFIEYMSVRVARPTTVASKKPPAEDDVDVIAERTRVSQSVPSATHGDVLIVKVEQHTSLCLSACQSLFLYLPLSNLSLCISLSSPRMHASCIHAWLTLPVTRR